MLGYFALGTLAAFGLLSLIWALFGWMLPDTRGCAVVFYGTPEPEFFARFKWLRSLGILNCPIILLCDSTRKPWEEAENCAEEELLLRLKQEYERYYGTGAGDSSGRGQRCGLPEL